MQTTTRGRFDGSKMKAVRKEKKYSQKQLATMTGLSLSAIQSYESGRYFPKADALARICAALDVRVGALYEWETVESPSEKSSPIEWDIQGRFEREWIRAGNPPHFGSEEGRTAALMYYFENLNTEGQLSLLSMIDILRKVPGFQKESKEQSE